MCKMIDSNQSTARGTRSRARATTTCDRRTMSHGTFDDSASPLRSSSVFSGGADDEIERVQVHASSTGDLDWNTLDETVWATLRRDVAVVGRNCAAVLLPINWGRDGAGRLREWDLWGPLVFVLALSATLSAGVESGSETFSVVFATVGIGAVALTANVSLLGGKIIFLQSVALLGYCIVPLVLASLLCLASSNKIFRLFIVGLAVAWSSKASIPFVSAAMPASRRALAVYPVMLLYVFLGWLAIARVGAKQPGGETAFPSPPPAPPSPA